MSGLPADIIEKLEAAANKKILEINVIWAALNDAIELIELVLRSETPCGRNWRKIYPDDAVKIDRLNQTLKHYRRVRRIVIRQGNLCGWNLNGSAKNGPSKGL